MKHTKNHKDEDQNPKKENPAVNEGTLKKNITKSGAIRMHGFAMSRNRRNQAKKDQKSKTDLDRMSHQRGGIGHIVSSACISWH